ncbi:hypothetical protein I79_017378 [Cricetulus griseus]|uniref:Uncharacterized protein n=1 Tax=Cricetulus griseus TaxID=10029 RepID=G3I1V9_CRIGR|nr:hypothetical protein I79_017378 [Cricetulus griseus]
MKVGCSFALRLSPGAVVSTCLSCKRPWVSSISKERQLFCFLKENLNYKLALTEHNFQSENTGTSIFILERLGRLVKKTSNLCFLVHFSFL